MEVANKVPNYIARRLQQYYGTPQFGPFVSPTVKLDEIVNDLAGKLKTYKEKPGAKDSYINIQADLIWRLHLIVETLQWLEPLDIWDIINKRIQRATILQESDYISLAFPIVLDCKDIETPRVAIIDLVGWNKDPNEY